jgi:ribosomal protein S2/predicted RNA-binding protein with TRAM domain
MDSLTQKKRSNTSSNRALVNKSKNFGVAQKNQNSLKNSKGILPSASNKLTKAIKVGNLYFVKITALSGNNLGLNEFTYGFPFVIGGLKEANVTLGDIVQVKVLKIQKVQGISDMQKYGVTKTYAITKITKVIKKGNAVVPNTNMIGQTVKATIISSKNGLKGNYLAELSDKSKVVIKSTGVTKLTVGQTVEVKVTLVKQKYSFAKLIGNNFTATKQSVKSNGLNQGTKFCFALVLPKKAKRYLKHIIIKLNSHTASGMATNSSLFQNINNNASQNVQKVPSILFVKPIAGVKLGDKVQIQVVKGFRTKKANIIIGKIYAINPLSSQAKKAIIKADIKKMLNSGMHYGEQAIKCNARMKNYVFSSSALANKSINSSSLSSPVAKTVQQLDNTWFNSNSPLLPKGFRYAEAGKNQNKPLIKKGRNIINLFKTRRCLNKALAVLTKYAAKGKTFLFVGTKKAASGLIARASLFSKKAFFVNTRWLGGMLTNWKTIYKSISKIRPILKEKQLIIKDILAKRQSIKTLLMEKAFVLQKKSKIVLQKGRQLLQKLLRNPSKVSLNQSLNLLIGKRKEFIQKGQTLLEKRALLLQKRKQLVSQSQALYQKAIIMTSNSKEYLNKATIIRKKLRELKSLLFVSQQLQKLQLNAKKQNKDVYTVSYNQFKSLGNNASVMPNPPKEILNKMVFFIKQNAALATSNITKKDASAKSVVVCTKLLSQFSSFAPAIKLSIKTLLQSLKQVMAKLTVFQETLKYTVNKMQQYVTLKNNIMLQLRQIQNSLINQRNVIRVVKRKLKQLSAQTRLIKFLPRLRFLPTPSSVIAQTVQVLMKKIVDPKLQYPIDAIYDQKAGSQSKKVASMRKKKWQRLEKYLGGIANMRSNKFNSASKQIRNNVAIIVGQQEEMNAVRECQKLGIKMFHIVDTNCNPGFADHFIPANDDSRNSIKFVLTQFLTRIRLAQKLRKVAAKASKK